MLLKKSTSFTNSESTITLKKVALFKKIEENSACFDIDVDVIYNNCIFFHKQAFNTHIRNIIISLTIRGFDINFHRIDKYVIVFMYFIETKKIVQ